MEKPERRGWKWAKQDDGVAQFSRPKMAQFEKTVDTYRENAKLQPLVAEISWTKHLVIIDRCKNDLQREFYIRMTRKMGWSKI